MSKTPVVGSVDAKVRVASHLSKVPLTATDAFTANLIELSSVVILKTGTCARLGVGKTADAKKKKTANCMLPCARLLDMNFLPPVAVNNQVKSQTALGLTLDVCSEVLSHQTGRSREASSAHSDVVGRK